MKPCADDELEAMLADLESDRVERKQSFRGDAPATVRVYWFDDRIEIHNPGGPFGSVTPENFGQPGVTDYRNPNLAEALRALGYVQRFGAGIAIARKALRNRLRFEVQPGFLAAIVAGEQP